MNIDLTTTLNVLKVHSDSENAVLISCGDVLSVCALRQRETTTELCGEELLARELAVGVFTLSGNRQRVAFGRDVQVGSTKTRDRHFESELSLAARDIGRCNEVTSAQAVGQVC